MKNALRRLQKLERLPQFQPPPRALKQINDFAMRQMSNEDLALMVTMAADQEARLDREMTERELAMWAVHDAALEAESQRMGFRSFADAERKGR